MNKPYTKRSMEDIVLQYSSRVTKSLNDIISPNSIILPRVIIYAMVNVVKSKFGDMLLLLGILEDILLRHCQKL